MSDSILDTLLQRFYESCDSSTRSLFSKCSVDYLVNTQTNCTLLSLYAKEESVAYRLARRSQSLYNRFRRLVGDNCFVAVIHDMADPDERAYIIEIDSAKKFDGYSTVPFININESRLKPVTPMETGSI